MSWPWRRRDEELDEEIRAHIEMSERERVERGATEDEARAAARREFGNVGLVRETTRDVWGFEWIERIAQDVRYGLRMMRRSPGFTAVAVVTLALGIGATTAIFSVFYGVLLRPLSYSRPNQIVAMSEINQSGGEMRFSDPDFEDVHAQNHTLQAVAEYDSGVTSVTGGTEPTRSMISAVSLDFFGALGEEAALGREFREDDQRPGAAPVAIVSYGYWRDHLGGVQNLSSLHLSAINRSYTVVGVLPPGFDFPDQTEIWLPRGLDPPNASRSSHGPRVVARMRDGATIAQARADIGAIAARIVAQFGTDPYSAYYMRGVSISSLQDELTGGVRQALSILLGAAGLLLLVACANVANLFLLRTAEREHELAIRAALGASRARLVRQFLTETLLICMLGGSLGVLTAFWGLDALLALAPKNLPRLEAVSINFWVLIFSLALTLCAAIGLGIFTALRATSNDPKNALGESGRTQAGRFHAQKMGRAIAGAEIAITLVLLVGAGLLGRSLLHVLAVDPGFRSDHIVTMDLSAPSAETPEGMPRQVAMLTALFERLRGMPGVENVGGAESIPLSRGLSDGGFMIVDLRLAPPTGAPAVGDTSPEELAKLIAQLNEYSKIATSSGNAEYCATSEGYFRALGIPLVRGRLFDDRDTMDAPQVAVVNESFARMEWPGSDPEDAAIGHSIEFGNMDYDLRPLTVIGVVGDVREYSLEARSRPTVYVTYRQRPQSTSDFTVVIRTTANPNAVITEARATMRGLDPMIATRFSTFSQMVSDATGSRRFSLTLACVFAATALLLAMVGIYGVMAYSVARRTREIGVRMALGAERGAVLRMVLGQGLVVTAAGIIAGVAGSLALTRTMKSMLFGVSTTDPITFGAVAFLLTLVALAACWIPARRATRVDPMVALRYE